MPIFLHKSEYKHRKNLDEWNAVWYNKGCRVTKAQYKKRKREVSWREKDWDRG